LPVPEKAQKQFNYVLFLRNACIPNGTSVPPTPDPLVITISNTAPKPGTIAGPSASRASAVSDAYKTLFDFFLTEQLQQAGNGVTITEVNPKLFASAQKEAHRPNEAATFIKAFRGSKDGYLFFLPSGILWGFKKPLVFLPKDQILAVSYINVLQRTFNMVIEVDSGASSGTASSAEKDEFEFSMLDQEDFANIDAYVKRHGLADASMAEQRRAKRLGINDVKGENGVKIEDGEPGELSKAAEALAEVDEADEEDEGTEGEDYDPGSEGESEGSGSSDEDDDDDDDGGGGEGGDDDEEEEEEGEEEL
jgi:hypothetical protein